MWPTVVGTHVTSAPALRESQHVARDTEMTGDRGQWRHRGKALTLPGEIKEGFQEEVAVEVSWN